MNLRRGFSFIELLVVFSIVALLASVILAAVSNSRGLANDARRISDLQQIENALELYALDHGGQYPPHGSFFTSTGTSNSDAVCGTGADWSDSADQATTNFVQGLRKYIRQLPKDPTNDGTHCYIYASNSGSGFADTAAVFATTRSVGDVRKKIGFVLGRKEKYDDILKQAQHVPVIGAISMSGGGATAAPKAPASGTTQPSDPGYVEPVPETVIDYGNPYWDDYGAYYPERNATHADTYSNNNTNGNTNNNTNGNTNNNTNNNNNNNATGTNNGGNNNNTTPVAGCMDSTAFNYKPTATVSDGSCIPVVLGCIDPDANNRNLDANTSDGSCTYDPKPTRGCPDQSASNYDPTAVVQDPSVCIPWTPGCTDMTAHNYNPSANQNDGSCTYQGCMDSSMWNYDSRATFMDVCIPYAYGCTDRTADNFNVDANYNDGSCVYSVHGCMTPGMYNYNPNAVVDDGSCQPYVYGCNDPAAYNYNPNVNSPDNTCDYSPAGCTDPNAYNYNSAATRSDGSCIAKVYGCMDSSATNYDANANTDSGSCVYRGCMDPTAFNYDPKSNVAGTCVPKTYGCMDLSASNYNPSANIDSGCTYIGCMDTAALNYDPKANVEGSCSYW